MASDWVKATKVIRTALGVLEREVVLPNLVWRDAVGDFAGAQNDTQTISIPAYVTARTRTLRTGTPITIDTEAETSVDVKLTTDVYKGIGITDEEMELDIEDFALQVSNPVLRSIVRGVEDQIADTISGATYTLEVTVDPDNVKGGVLSARTKLNKCHVPAGGRVLLVGSELEEAILDELTDGLVSDMAGSALKEATIAGRYRGFVVVSSNAIAPDEGYAFHRTAFISAMRAPKVPAGANWGASATYNGFALRMIRDYDALNLTDRFIGNVWVGNAAVYDNGELDEDGVFTPYEDADEIDSGTPILVRACKLTLGS